MSGEPFSTYLQGRVSLTDPRPCLQAPSTQPAPRTACLCLLSLHVGYHTSWVLGIQILVHRLMCQTLCPLSCLLSSWGSFCVTVGRWSVLRSVNYSTLISVKYVVGCLSQLLDSGILVRGNWHSMVPWHFRRRKGRIAFQVEEKVCKWFRGSKMQT